MQHTPLLATLALLTAAVSANAVAEDRAPDAQRARKDTKEIRAADGYDHGMHTVPHNAAPNAPGYGWRYFSDPVTRRAVVISPQGDYYFSRGKGLRWVAAELS